MRGKVAVVWLEDKPNERAHSRRVKLVKEAIENKGYDSDIEEVNTLEEAKKILSNKEKRVDFFISDYNLGGEETGLEYLLEIRNKGLYKQFFILYSNNDYDVIRYDVIEKLKNNNIDLFSNFTFFSLAGSTTLVSQDFTKAVGISLSRWDELNAIRGLYMCEHAELELLLKNKFPEFNDESYTNLFKRLERSLTSTYKNIHGATFKKWGELIEYRNLLAHTSEECDPEKGFYIKANSLIIYESDLDEERVRLKELKEKIAFLIENPNRSYPLQIKRGSKESVLN